MDLSQTYRWGPARQACILLHGVDLAKTLGRAGVTARTIAVGERGREPGGDLGHGGQDRARRVPGREEVPLFPVGLKPGLGPLRGRVLKDMT